MSATRESVRRAAEFLCSIASPHRLMILCLLVDRPLTVTELCEATGARQSLVSQHLSRLRLDNLVQSERLGHFVRYSLTDTPAREIVAILHENFCATSTGRDYARETERHKLVASAPIPTAVDA